MSLSPTRIRSWLDRYDVARMLEILVLLLILADFARVVVRLIGMDAALHWDEAVYAIRARGWVDGDAPVSGWSYIRPPAMPFVASLAVLAGGEEWHLRLVGLVAGLGFLVGAWWLGRMIAGPIAGLAAAATLYSSPMLQKESGVFLTDIPAAALLVLLAGLLWHELEMKPRPGLLLLVAAAVAGIAFLTRYGSIIVIVPMLVLGTAVWWRRLVAGGWIVVGALATGAAVVIGHVAWSITQTGSPLGILSKAQAVVPPWEGRTPFDEFQRWLEFELAGSIGSVAIWAGLASIPVAAVLLFGPARLRAQGRGMLLLALTGAAQVAVLVSGVGHVEPRFFAPAAALLVVSGVALVTSIARALPRPVQAALVAGFAVAVVAFRGPAVDHSFQRTAQVAAYYAQFRTAGLKLADLSGESCAALSGGYPIVSWYSRCATLPVLLGAGGVSPAGALTAEDAWLVVFGRLADISMDDPTLATILDDAVGAPTVIRDSATHADIAALWRLEPGDR